MKQILTTFCFLIAIAAMGQSTQQRTIITSSALFRQMATNEGPGGILVDLNISPLLTNYNFSSQAHPNQFLWTPDGTNVQSTLNGAGLTNVHASVADSGWPTTWSGSAITSAVGSATNTTGGVPLSSIAPLPGPQTGYYVWNETWNTNNTGNYTLNDTFYASPGSLLRNSWGVYGAAGSKVSVQNKELVMQNPSVTGVVTLLARTNVGPQNGLTIIWRFRTGDFASGSQSGFLGGVTTNDYALPQYGWTFDNTTGLHLYGGSTINISTWKPNTSVAIAMQFLGDKIRYWVQGGYYNPNEAYFDSPNWFQFGAQTNTYYTAALEPLFCIQNLAQGVLDSIQVITNWNPGTISACLADQTIAGGKPHVPSLTRDPSGNLIAGWHITPAAKENTTNTYIQVAFRTNGFWSDPQIVVSGSSPTNYEMGGLSSLGATNYIFYDQGNQTSGVNNDATNNIVKFRTIGISGGTLVFGPELDVNVTNPPAFSGTNFLCLGPAITAPDGSWVLPVMGETNWTTDINESSYCLRSENGGVTWSANLIGTLNTVGTEPMFFIQTNALHVTTRSKITVSPDSGKTWGSSHALPVYSQGYQRVAAEGLPDGTTLFWESDQNSNLRNYGKVFVTRNGVAQSGFYFSPSATSYSAEYPFGLYHDGLVATIWEDTRHIYFSEQTLDRRDPNIINSLEAKVTALLDRQAPLIGMTTNVQVVVLQAGVTNYQTLNFTNGALMQITTP